MDTDKFWEANKFAKWVASEAFLRSISLRGGHAQWMEFGSRENLRRQINQRGR